MNAATHRDKLKFRAFAQVALIVSGLLFSHSSAYSQSTISPKEKNLAPLVGDELSMVLKEILAREQVYTREEIAQFKRQEATPSRIERLYQMPELPSYPKKIRRSGLLFAGQGGLLQFEKPSDILGKVAGWFPQELEKARAADYRRLSNWIYLEGPFLDWEVEPAAFISLWNCMPQVVWLFSDKDPYQYEIKSYAYSRQITTFTENSDTAFRDDFEGCIRKVSGYRELRSESGKYEGNAEEILSIASRVSPFLSKKFDDFLVKYGCSGKGPDDCLLILDLWSSLAPNDKNLARHVQGLEATIKPDKTLPSLGSAADQMSIEMKRIADEKRYSEGIRQSVFLKVKLASILNAPESWPADALRVAIHQVRLFEQKIARAKSTHGDYQVKKFDQYRDAVIRNASAAGAAGAISTLVQKTKMSEYIVAEVERVPMNHDGFDEYWLQWGEETAALYALLHSKNTESRVHSVPWDWLMRGESETALEYRSQFIAKLNKNDIDESQLHEQILEHFTNNGLACFQENTLTNSPWIAGICKKWVHAPTSVSVHLPTLGFELDFDKRFQSEIYGERFYYGGKFKKVLTELANGLDRRSKQIIEELTTTLTAQGYYVPHIKIWHLAGYSHALISLEIDRRKIYLLRSATELTKIILPQRYKESDELAYVSDLDGDGNLELWFSDSQFKNCPYNDSSLEREFDCAKTTLSMGELNGKTVSYFISSSRAKIPALPIDWQAQSKLKDSTKDSVVDVGDAYRLEPTLCNEILISSLLSKKMSIAIGTEWDRDGDIFDMICREHPQNRNWFISAFLFNLKNAEGNYISEKIGLGVTIIDKKKREVKMLYQDTLEETVLTLSNSLKFNFVNQLLPVSKSKVAFGISITGGSNGYFGRPEPILLNYFLHEDNRLFPIIKNFTASPSIWRKSGCKESSEQIDPQYAAIHTVDTVLTPLPSKHNGWIDVEVKEVHKKECIDLKNAGKSETEEKIILRKMIAKNKIYSFD